jgi:nitrogen-specific signal transduction histidine kinase/CheY-like chemotaxis protein
MFTGIVRDITERKQLEAQLAQAQKMESVGQLAGGIAHDFNNQLGIVLFDLDMLLAERQQDARLREDLLKMRRVVLRAANLTRQLLFFSRRQPLEPRPLDLNHQVRELQKMVGRLLGAAIRVETDLAEDLWIATADPASIDQVILNLALNSRDAMPQGGVLKFTTDNLELDDQHSRHPSQARPGRFVCLKVQDTGTGMEEHVRQRVFEPFFTTKEPGKGTGLGLSVVYGIIEAHRGWIEVESAPGKGSTFSFYLPAPDKEVEEREPSAPEGTAARQRGRGERILLLEDEPDLCERTRRVLTDHGYAVQSCHTVAQARELFRQADGRFDLAICDATVPDGRGTQLAFHLRGGRPGLAVLVITGYLDNHPDWERVRRERVPVLQKPFAVTELLDQVHAALHS